jgi:hypothetical protein
VLRFELDILHPRERRQPPMPNSTSPLIEQPPAPCVTRCSRPSRLTVSRRRSRPPTPVKLNVTLRKTSSRGSARGGEWSQR